MSPTSLPHAFDRVHQWTGAWNRTGRMVLLLDFDGTLAPIVDRPDQAAMPPRTRGALDHLRSRPGLEVAVVSGRGLADARGRMGIEGIAYAGNHGMEIEGPGIDRVHEEAAAARPVLAAVAQRLTAELASVDGAIVEDKQLTLSVHYRLVAPEQWDRVRAAVDRSVGDQPALRVTEGKRVIEVRPDVQWDKGRAVEFLLSVIRPEPGVPVLYLGDDRTDEDAFAALRRDGRGEGVVVADPLPSDTYAAAFVRDPGEVGELLERLGGKAG